MLWLLRELLRELLRDISSSYGVLMTASVVIHCFRLAVTDDER